MNLLQSEHCDTSADVVPVLKKVHMAYKATLSPVHGCLEDELNGKTCVNEYEPDADLHDT